MSIDKEKLSVDQKALAINLNPKFFGTFAEIGAGQEVARHFFRVGGAAGTIAKTISAYDMTFSDAIYGKVGRYVSRERLQTMLQHEYKLLLERLSAKRGSETQFFVFSNTVTARSFKGGNECHGWLGVRFQTSPLGEPNDVIIHVRMLDRENVLQQQALGMFGVNLMYGALYLKDNPDAFIRSLIDDLSVERIEVDMLEFYGPDMNGVDNRLLSLKLLQHNLTNAIMFSPDRRVLQPSEVLYKRPLLVERGSFRPVTFINLDMMEGSKSQFLKEPAVKDKEPLALFEITLNNLVSSTGNGFDDKDFLARSDTLSALGYTVLISNYSEHYRLVEYFRRYSKEMIGLVMGINSLMQIFDDRYYEQLEGGILEALGRLFSNKVKGYVYPMAAKAYQRYFEGENGESKASDLLTAKDVNVPAHLRLLFEHLLASKSIEPITEFSPEHLSILSKEVFDQIRKGGKDWEKAVPSAAVYIIKQRKMFGYKGEGELESRTESNNLSSSH